MGDRRKLTGRPLLKKGKRVKKIGARFTQEEYDIIVALEKQLGVTETDLVRIRLLNDASTYVVNAKNFIVEIDQLGAKMGRVGNNINQLARHANTLKLAGSLQASVAIRFNELFEQYLVVLQAVEATLRKIIREMGK